MQREANQLTKLLKERELRLALAESVTCGMASYYLSGCPHTTDVFSGSIVCYTPEVKSGLLHVPKKLIDDYTCESKQVTEALAKKIRLLIDADVFAAVTGLAAPGGSETKSKPVGTIFISVYYKKKIYNRKFVFRGTPNRIKRMACAALFREIDSLVSSP